MSSFYVENFGCRATQADGAAIEQQLREHGLNRAGAPASAEWVVLNTCAVTAAAEQDARAAIRRVRRANPQCKIVVTGCYAQRAPDDVASLPGVSCVVGNTHKHNLAQIALSKQSGTNSIATSFFPVHALMATPDSREQTSHVPVFISDIFAHTELMAAPVFDSANERTRPNLKVQDGCGNRCSFCIIPSLRGRSRSLPLSQVVEQVNELVAAGYREVVISGINLGRWGRDLPARVGVQTKSDSSAWELASEKPMWDRRLACPPRPYDLEDLIRAVMDRTPLEKLRISSVEPMDWSDSLIELVAGSLRIARHAHVPMQSGSDAVLRRMHRKYRPWHYREKIEKIRAAMPTAAIGADVMVGFPGETEGEFEETRRMIEDLPLTYLHVFTFSARPGTPAATMPNQVPAQHARERNRILRELSAAKKAAFMRSFIGGPIKGITLAGNAAHSTEVLTDNYLPLKLKMPLEPNRWIIANVDGMVGGRLIGTPQPIRP